MRHTAIPNRGGEYAQRRLKKILCDAQRGVIKILGRGLGVGLVRGAPRHSVPAIEVLWGTHRTRTA